MGGSPMGTTPLPIDAIPHGQQLRDLSFTESIPGLHRRLATHHVQDVRQRRFMIVSIDLALCGAFQKFREERPRIHAA